MNENDKTLVDHSSKIARLVLPFLGSQKIPATPENYMIFYLYFESQSSSLVEEVDRRLQSGQSWTSQTTLDVFDRLFSETASVERFKRNEAVRLQLQHLASGILDESTATAELAVETGRSIDKSLDKVCSLGEVKEMAAWLQGVIREVREVGRVSAGLGASLNEKISELDSLLTNMDDVEVLVLTDELTQLPNRRAWDHKLSNAFTMFRRVGQKAAVIIFDIDDFKKLNDAFGHLVGDAALKQVSMVCSGAVKGDDFVARYGGEEFGVLLPDTNLANATAVAENLRRRLEMTKFTIRGQRYPVTASFGVAKFQDSDPNPSTALERADKALYLAKSRGKNQVRRQDEVV